MAKKTLTPEERRAYQALARAAERLREIQQRKADKNGKRNEAATC